MCGVFGYLGATLPESLGRCARTLSHRGPDAFGEFADPNGEIYLGHCRLSIIDLLDRARQPMSTEDGRFTLVYNGEIYNYRLLRKELESLGCRFRTESDTEVLLQAYVKWDTGCLDRLVGMFAFAIWDCERRKLFLARDRLGIKPLYVTRGKGFFAFASEAKALLSLPDVSREVNPEGLASFLLHGYVLGQSSIWCGMERLPPGQWLALDAESGREQRGTYWMLQSQPERISLTEAAEQFEELFGMVTADHLVADVPVGVLLSAGIDSGLIAAFSAGIHPGLSSFSMGVTGWQGSELDAARTVAKHLGISNTARVLASEDFARVEETLDLFDEPLGDTAIFPTVALCLAARSVIKVALSGDGGDESFGGYRWYSHLEGNRYLRGSKYFVESVRRRLGAGRPSPNGSANALEYRRFLTSPSFSVGEILRLFPWLKPDACRAALEETSRRFNTDAKGYKRWQLLDALTYLVDNNLFRVDRASMAHSLEVRVPFVDHRLVEFAFSLPDRLCVARNETKVLLRHEVKSRLPAPIATRGKQGFSFPLNSLWPLERMAASVRDGDLVRQGMIDAKELTRLLNERTTGHWPYKVWLLAVLEHWCRRWFGGSVA